MNKKYMLLPLLLFSVSLFSQIPDFSYQRKIGNVQTGWEKIYFPDDLFSKIRTDISDIRIYGMNEKDTVEVPYLLRIHESETNYSRQSNKIINQSVKDGKYFFTIRMTDQGSVNQILLNFSNSNFSWKATLEGSNDQNSWFKLATDQPLISVENELTQYRFTTLQFGEADYRFFRLSIDANMKPELLSAEVIKTKSVRGTYRNYHFTPASQWFETRNKITTGTLKLTTKIPVSSARIQVDKTTDFYRSLIIYAITDSVKTSTGYSKRFSQIYSGTISSFEEPFFSFSPVMTDDLKFEIRNNDNQPLRIDSLTVSAPVYELTAKFSADRNYVLKYGNKKISPAVYDLEIFRSQIPENTELAVLLDEENLQVEKQSILLPIFKTKTTLWIVIIAVVLLLGFFAVKMITGNENSQTKV